jgi:hypothetical protein
MVEYKQVPQWLYKKGPQWLPTGMGFIRTVAWTVAVVIHLTGGNRDLTAEHWSKRWWSEGGKRKALADWAKTGFGKVETDFGAQSEPAVGKLGWGRVRRGLEA